MQGEGKDGFSSIKDKNFCSTAITVKTNRWQTQRVFAVTKTGKGLIIYIIKYIYIYLNLFFQKSARKRKAQRKLGRGRSFLVVQWLGLGTFTAVARGSIPGQGTKISQATRHGQKRRKEK